MQGPLNQIQVFTYEAERNALSLLHPVDFVEAEAIQRGDARLLLSFLPPLSFLPRDSGVKRGQFRFEGAHPRDPGGAAVRGQIPKRVAAPLAGRPFRA